MIPYDQFGALRLAQFLPKADLADLQNWEFMDDLWLGEAHGFSEWLRLESDSDVLRSLSIDFSTFPEDAAAEVLRALDLPVHASMSFDELSQRFGSPIQELHFVSDRVSYEYALAGPPAYNISFTALKSGGLSYIVVVRPN